MRIDHAQAASTAGSSLFLKAAQSSYQGPERRRERRIPKSIGIIVQPLTAMQTEAGEEFFAITRDVSRGGLAFLSPRRCDFELVVLSLQHDRSRMVVGRICNCNLIHASEHEEVYLTSVEFLYERPA